MRESFFQAITMGTLPENPVIIGASSSSSLKARQSVFVKASRHFCLTSTSRRWPPSPHHKPRLEKAAAEPQAQESVLKPAQLLTFLGHLLPINRWPTFFSQDSLNLTEKESKFKDGGSYYPSQIPVSGLGAPVWVIHTYASIKKVTVLAANQHRLSRKSPGCGRCVKGLAI